MSWVAASLPGCDARVPDSVIDGEGPRVIESSPAAGDDEVVRAVVLRARFDRPLDPDTVHRSSVRLGSGPQSVFLSLRLDPIERSLRVAPFRGSLLEPEVIYRWALRGIRDLDGRAMAPWEVRFRTGTTTGEPPPAEPAVPWGEVGPLFETRCATAEGCHGAASPALGLDLSSAEGVRRTALALPSRQVAAGGPGPDGEVSGPGLVGMSIIDVLGGQGRPETSYLVYKLLDDPHILGEPMPPEASLPEDELKALSRWIRHGAPTE